MAKRRTVCRRGHDLTDESNRRKDRGGCLICYQSRPYTATRVRRRVRFSKCTGCMRSKHRDARPLCLSCAAADRYEQAMREAALDAVLGAKVRLESAPQWVKQGTEAVQRRWLGLPSTLPLRSEGDSVHNVQGVGDDSAVLD